jgi:hypothetical protein
MEEKSLALLIAESIIEISKIGKDDLDALEKEAQNLAQKILKLTK